MGEIILFITLGVILVQTSYLVAASFKIKQRRASRPIFVDTSVLIDGRIEAIARTGFIPGTLLIPRSVLGELQFMADQADPERRARARHGLDVATNLRNIEGISVEIFADQRTVEEGVDNRLLALAKRHHGALCTIDFNLNKVARAENITVLNVNDLAKDLRMAHLPGEKITIALTQKGNDSHQAIGHLDDGTMVVVEQAAGAIGKAVEVEFIRSLQTAAGKMLFARLVQPLESKAKTQKPAARKQPNAATASQPVGRKPAPRNDARPERRQSPQGGATPQSSPQQQAAQPKPHQQPQASRPQRPSQSRRRPLSKEESLIALVNQQPDD